MFTLDASVILNAANPREAGHAASLDLLRLLRERKLALMEPTLLLPELAGAARRTQGSAARARALAVDIARVPNLRLVDLDRPLAELAVGMAAQQALRGADAVYAAVAQRSGSQLVTRDGEQLERLKGVISALTPEEVLQELYSR